jgi:hypothetical protein
MSQAKSWMGVLFVMTLLFPNVINSAEVTQKIRIGLPSSRSPTCLFTWPKKKAFSSKSVSKRNTYK